MRRAKRIPPPPEGITLTIRFTDKDEPPVEYAHSRHYDDGHGLVEVVRRTPHPQFEQFGKTFTYDGALIADIAPVSRGRYYTNATTELVGCARVLSMLGYPNAELQPREPPEPDMFVVQPDLGKFYMEFTLGTDPDEREFQEGIKLIAAAVSERLAARPEAWIRERGVNLSFERAPKRGSISRFADEIVALILATDGRGGTHHVEDARLQKWMPSFQITVGGKNKLVAGSLPLLRGMSDYTTVTQMRIAEKLAKTYATNGLPLWVAVGLALPLIKPNFMGELYATNVELAHLNRIVVDDSNELIDYRRVTRGE